MYHITGCTNSPHISTKTLLKTCIFLVLVLMCLFTQSKVSTMPSQHQRKVFQIIQKNTKNEHSTSVNWLTEQNFLANELQGGCYGSEYNLIRHLVISLTPYNPSLFLPFLLFSVNCPQIPPTPPQNVSLFWNLHTTKEILMWQRLHPKQSSPVQLCSLNVDCRHAAFHSICIPVPVCRPLAVL